MIAGEPIVGIRTNGTRRLPEDRADGVDGEERPRLRPSLVGVVAQQGGGRREGDPEQDGDRQDDEHGRAEERSERLERPARRQRLGLAEHEDQADEGQRPRRGPGSRPASRPGRGGATG